MKRKNKPIENVIRAVALELLWKQVQYDRWRDGMKNRGVHIIGQVATVSLYLFCEVMDLYQVEEGETRAALSHVFWMLEEHAIVKDDMNIFVDVCENPRLLESKWKTDDELLRYFKRKHDPKSKRKHA